MAILNLQESGRIQMLYNKWWKNTGTCSNDEKKQESKASSLGKLTRSFTTIVPHDRLIFLLTFLCCSKRWGNNTILLKFSKLSVFRSCKCWGYICGASDWPHFSCNISSCWIYMERTKSFRTRQSKFNRLLIEDSFRSTWWFCSFFLINNKVKSM